MWIAMCSTVAGHHQQTWMIFFSVLMPRMVVEFSSHTIYTMTFVCIVFKYFNFRWLKLMMALSQIAIVPFILAARTLFSWCVYGSICDIIGVRNPVDSFPRPWYINRLGKVLWDTFLPCSGKQWFFQLRGEHLGKRILCRSRPTPSWYWQSTSFKRITFSSEERWRGEDKIHDINCVSSVLQRETFGAVQ